jgi:hypothetical protein
MTRVDSRAVAMVALSMICASLAFMISSPAEAAESPESSPGLRFSFSAAPIYQFGADVDGGGTLSVARFSFGADMTGKVSKDLALGLGLTYELDDYDFSGLTGFRVSTPWNQVHRFGISTPAIYTFAEDWRLVVSPSVQFAGESGADWGDAIAVGGVVSVSYAFRRDFVLGAGVGAFSNIEKVSVFPYIVVNWRITDSLRLANPFRTSPAGPAGLELAYAIDSHWELAAGGAYRSFRFRLDESGPIPGGIGESTLVPVFARLSYKFSRWFQLDLYGGASFLNKLRIEDSGADLLYRTKYDVAPLVSLTFKAEF